MKMYAKPRLELKIAEKSPGEWVIEDGICWYETKLENGIEQDCAFFVKSGESRRSRTEIVAWGEEKAKREFAQRANLTKEALEKIRFSIKTEVR